MKIDLKKQKDIIVVNITEGNYMWLIQYLQGYYKAAQQLNSILNNEDYRTVVYPLLFLVLHYMEMWVKFLAYCLNETEKVSFQYDKHNFIAILNRISISITEYGVNAADIQKVKEQYEWFLRFDKSRNENDLPIVFKYPIKTNGKDTIIDFEEIEYLKEDNFHGLSERISGLFGLTLKILGCFLSKFFEDQLEKNGF